jgi:hypothetical protein
LKVVTADVNYPLFSISGIPGEACDATIIVNAEKDASALKIEEAADRSGEFIRVNIVSFEFHARVLAVADKL